MKDIIRQHRQQQGLTQQQLAKLVNVNRKTVISWEKGEFYPKGPNLIKLNEVLGVNLAQNPSSKVTELKRQMEDLNKQSAQLIEKLNQVLGVL